MASRANQGRKRKRNCDSTVTHLFSMNSTGAVFRNTKPLEVLSELTITVQATVLGLTSDWSVRGWVVECQPERAAATDSFRVTLLFSELPEDLRDLLMVAEQSSVGSYPPVTGAEVFG